jgi:hypothetical protein
MIKEIQLDLANETVRRYGPIESDFPERMARRIYRKFGAKVDVKTVSERVRYYKEIYASACSILSECLQPPEGEYADIKDVDLEKYLARIEEQFPTSDRDILETIAGWTIYYEYLR